jgi:Ca2+-binding EF-hand superfamily protein
MEEAMRKSTMMGAVLAAALTAAAGAALAQPMMGEGAMRGQGAGMDFSTFDLDGDGRVTAEEIEAYRAGRFAELDADGDGQVSRQEFMDFAAARATERAGTMFDRFDVDGDGLLSRDAVEARWGSHMDAARMIERLDADGDGAISEEEFTQMRQGWRQRMGERMEGRDGMRHRGDRDRPMMGHGFGRRNDG